jgi:transposase
LRLRWRDAVVRGSVSPLEITLTAGERHELERRARSYTASYAEVVRAKIVLMAAEGITNVEIAARCDTSPQVVYRWRKRFCERRLRGLEDAPRSGRPRVFSPSVNAEIKALACELPATSGVPLSRWSCSELARELILRGVVAFISAATIWRTLRSDAIKPWLYRSWIFPRDPDFAAKAAVVLDLYARIFEGRRLGKRDYVISSDEKTSIQARCRCHPTLPPGRARMMRVEHEYDRGGALAYLAAYDVHRAQLFGRTEPTTGIEPFGRLVEQVMTSQPYASARRVFWVVDNGSSHRGQASVRRLESAWPNLRLIHLPVHASWLNQIEIVFSVIQRKVVSPNDFIDLDRITDRLAAFEHRYNAVAEPFDWRFTRADLAELLERIADHARAAPLLSSAA